MLYQSLKQTILEYEKRKKQTQSEGERKMFKWKVFALTFCIILIVLIGILSQLVQFTQQQQGLNHNFTFLPTLLQQSNELDQIDSIKNLVYGFNKSPRIIFDKSQKIFDGIQISSQQLVKMIEGKRNVVFLFHLKEQLNPDEQPLIYRFGMLLKQQYDSQIDPENGVINVFDNIEDLSSVFFNLNQKQAIRLNLNAGCKIYSYNETSKSIRLIESVQLANQEETQRNRVNFEVTKQECFGQNESEALQQIKKLTGIQLLSLKQTKDLEIEKLQIFYLTFNGANVE